MTDTFTTDEGETQEQQGGQENGNLKHLREQAERAKTLEAEVAQLRRESAVLKSGIDADHPLGKFFVENFKGDISDTNLLLEEAKALGVPMKNAPAFDGTEQTTTQAQGEQAAATQHGQREVLEPTGTEQRRALAGEGYDIGGDGSPDPRQVALKEAEDAIKGGATQDQAGGHFIARMAQAAGRGDPRVIIETTSERTKTGQPIQRWQ